ncbi:MAG: hypothetical protein C4575_14425 [Desulforudis sp.]|nr:MAG: hypothetical protein C4575_14425 [Desulforudis sp.]
MITPKGMAEKTSLAYRYLISSYQHIIRITQVLESVVSRQAASNGVPPQVVFYSETTSSRR